MKIRPKCLREEEHTVEEYLDVKHKVNPPNSGQIRSFNKLSLFQYWEDTMHSNIFTNIDPRWLDFLDIKMTIGYNNTTAKMLDDLLIYENLCRILNKYSLKLFNKPLSENSQTENKEIYDKLILDLGGKYGEKWNRLWEIMVSEYNPIENYNMVENETENGNNDVDETTSTDTTGKTEYGKVVDNDRNITEDATNTGRNTIKNNGTNVNDIKTDNTQTTDSNTTNKGNVTETTDRTNTLIGDNSNLETRNTEQLVNQSGDETRTDNLKEVTNNTSDNTRTDNLEENITSNKDNTETNNLEEKLNSLDDNNKTINNTETRTDELKEVVSKDGTNTETTDMQHKTVYDTTEKEDSKNNTTVSGTNTRTDNLTEGTNGSREKDYGKTINTDNGKDYTTKVNEGGDITVTNTYEKVYTETTTDKNTDDKGNYYQEIVGDLAGSDPYIEKKIISGAYEETSTYDHTRTEPQDRSYTDERKTTGSSHTKTEQEEGTSAFNSTDYQPVQKITNEETTDKYPVETTTHKPGDGNYIVTDKTTEGKKDTTKRTYSLPTSDGGVENYKETTEMLGKRLELRGGKTSEILHVDGDRQLGIPSKDEEKTEKGLETKTTDEGTDYSYTKEGGKDEEKYNETKTNSGTVKTDESSDKEETISKTNTKLGNDTLTDEGTVKNVMDESTTKDNTGTVENKIVGKEDDLHTIESTKTNTGTIENKELTTTGKTNTGTVKESLEEDGSRTNTGTVNTETSNEQTTTDTGTIKNDETKNETQKDTGTVTTENDLTNTTVSTVTDDGTQKNTETVDMTQEESSTNITNSTTSDKLKISQSGEDNVTENVSGKRKELSTHDITRLLTRKGNIGVTTTQQMLEQQYNLWEEFSFAEIIINDVKKLLTISIY